MWRGKDEVCEGGTCSPTAKPISAPVSCRMMAVPRYRRVKSWWVTLPWPFVVDPVEKERGDNSNLSFLTAKPHGLRDALTWMGYPRFSGVVPRVCRHIGHFHDVSARIVYLGLVALIRKKFDISSR